MVIGYSKLLSTTLPDESVREGLEIILNQAQLACRMLDDLVYFVKRSGSDKSLVDVRDPLERAIRLRKHQLRTNDIRLVKRLSSPLPMVPADDRRMAHVFLHLITNAERAMSSCYHGGVLTVRAKVWGGFIRVTVQDSGPGIGSEHLESIFEPFVTNGEANGRVGMGLWACRLIVEDHGGEIWAENRAGRGSAFHVQLPIRASQST